MGWSDILGAAASAAASYYGNKGNNDTAFGYSSYGSGSGNSSLWSALGSGLGSYFSSGSGWSDLLGGVMSGIGASSEAELTMEQAERAAELGRETALAVEAAQGDQSRRTSAFEAQLKDFYEQKDKYNKRVALDTYGQFSVLNRRSPGYTPPPAAKAPTAPRLEDYSSGV